MQKDMQSRVRQIDEFLKKLVLSVIEMNEKYFILKTLKDENEFREALRRKLQVSSGAKSFNHLIILMWHDFIREQIRLFLDEQKKVASLCNISRKISEKKIFEKLLERCCSNLMPCNSESETKELFQRRWDDHCKCINILKDDPVSIKIKVFRDKYHEHLEMPALDNDTPSLLAKFELSYDDLLNFASKNTRIVLALNELINNERIVWESVENLYTDRSYQMWRILAS